MRGGGARTSGADTVRERNRMICISWSNHEGYPLFSVRGDPHDV